MSPRIPTRLLAAQPDERLVALARDGHERAFEALVQRYRRPLLRYCRRMRLSDPRAEDVLQQSFLRAWLALSRGSEVRECKPWLYRIVHNTAVNSMRSASAEGGALAEVAHTTSTHVADPDLGARLAAREALSEVAALPDMQRQAICLTALGGQSHEEVASALGISDGAVRGLLYRARSTLRSAAAALTPPWLIARPSGGSSTSALAEISSGGGAVGVSGMIAKGAVVAVTAGVLATGAGVVSLPRHAARHDQRQAPLSHASTVRAGREPSGVAIASVGALRRSGGAEGSDDRTAGRAGDGHRGRGRDPGGRGGGRAAPQREDASTGDGRDDSTVNAVNAPARDQGGQGGGGSSPGADDDPRQEEGVAAGAETSGNDGRGGPGGGPGDSGGGSESQASEGGQGGGSSSGAGAGPGGSGGGGSSPHGRGSGDGSSGNGDAATPEGGG